MFDYCTKDEANRAKRLVQTILSAGYCVSVNDDPECSGDWVVKQSVDFDAICKALNSTEGDTLRIRQHAAQPGDGERARAFVGDIVLVWGNSAEELIADHTDNQVIEYLCS